MAKKKWYRFPVYLLIRGVALLFSSLPRNGMLILASWLGTLGYVMVSRQRIKTLENLRRAFGREKSEAQIRKIARGVFRNFAMTAGETVSLPSWNLKKIQKYVDCGKVIETYRELLSRGRGVVFMTAHIGHWELAGGAITQHGLLGAAVARRIYYEPYNQWICSLRNRVGFQTLYRDTSSREILRRLKRNQIIGIVPDQDLSGAKGIFVPFFGIPAYTPVAPVRIAIAAGAPMVVNFMIRVSRTHYRFELGGVLHPAEDPDQENAVKKYTEAWMQLVESIIRRYPDQWGWMHDRWKTRPGADNSTHLEEAAQARR